MRIAPRRRGDRRYGEKKALLSWRDISTRFGPQIVIDRVSCLPVIFLAASHHRATSICDAIVTKRRSSGASIRDIGFIWDLYPGRESLSGVFLWDMDVSLGSECPSGCLSGMSTLDSCLGYSSRCKCRSRNSQINVRIPGKYPKRISTTKMDFLDGPDITDRYRRSTRIYQIDVHLGCE